MRLLAPFWNFEERRLRALWRLTLHLLITIVTLVACSSVIVALSLLGVDTTGTAFFVAGALVQTVALIIASSICYILFDRRKLSELRVDPGFVNEFLVGCLMGAMLMTGVFLVCLLFGWVQIESFGAASLLPLLHLVGWQVAWLLLMILVGVSEEFFSRGLQFKNLAEGLKPLGIAASVLFAMVISAAFFGVLHLGNPNATWFSTVSITGAGIMLATARLLSGRLALPIGIHTTWNYFQGPIFGFSVSGQDTPNSLMQVTSSGPVWLTGGEFGPEAGLLGAGALLVGIALTIAWRVYSKPIANRPIALDFIQLVRYQVPRRRKTLIAATNAAQADKNDSQLIGQARAEENTCDTPSPDTLNPPCVMPMDQN